MNLLLLPKWAREIVRFQSVKPQLIVWGNIYDVYPLEMRGSMVTLRVVDYLKSLLKENGYGILLNYEPLYGFTLLDGNADTFTQITEETLGKDQSLVCGLAKSVEIIEQLVNSNKANSAVILNFASRLPEISKNDIDWFYYKLFRLAQLATPKIVGEGNQSKFNLLIWVLDKENDVPAWYIIDNPKIKVLTIAKPDYGMRRDIIENYSKNIDGFNDIEDRRKKDSISLFIDQTNGLHASEIVAIVDFARTEKIPFSEIGEAIKMYKLGIVENPWSKLETAKIISSEQLLARRVVGQDTAIRKSSDIIKRAVYNLSGSQYSKYSQRPKGVMFFAGPTGVGKTELAKSITELLFGTETSYIRFDMSEFAQEHSDQRLVGAPPGYVGYDVGGQLTNAIKQNPFSVVLFDEIEKAHPRILDVFLQILDDGRLTSGSGETTYFSESLIIFTSNLGIYEVTTEGKRVQRVSPEMPYGDIQTIIREAIDDYFKYKLGRSEILNRIGENIVVFDFIRPDAAERIFTKMLENVLFKLADSYKIKIEFTPDCKKKLGDICCKDLNMGGRGIGNKLEDAFINPLSRSLFELQAKETSTVVIQDITQNETLWNIAARIKSS